MDFKMAKPSDASGLMELWKAAFPAHSERQRDVLRDCLEAGLISGAKNVLLAMEKERIVGSVMNTLSKITLDGVEFDVASVGEVAVSPELQGCGVGGKLMLGNNQLLKENGIVLARLGGLSKFYSRFEFERVPSYFWKLPLNDFSGGARRIPYSEILDTTQENVSGIRNFDLRKDFKACRSVSSEYQKDLNGAVVHTDAYEKYEKSRSNPSELKRRVLEKNGQVKAFLFSYGEGGSTIYDYGCAANSESSLAALFKKHLRDSLNAGLAEVTIANLARDGRLMRILQTEDIPFIENCTHSTISSSMIAAIAPETLTAKLAPRISRRLSESRISTRIGKVECVASDSEEKLLSFELGGAGDTAGLRISRRDLLMSLFGLTVPENIETLTKEMRELFRAIFPYNPGRFI